MSLRIWPTKREYLEWSIPAKLTFIGAYVGIFSLAMAITLAAYDHQALNRDRVPQSRAPTERARETVLRYVEAINRGEIDGLLEYYGEYVDYFESGMVNQRAIKDDKLQYHVRWPIQKWTITGPIQVDVSSDNQSVSVVFDISFLVGSPGRKERITGLARNEWRMIVSDQGAKIVGEKQMVTDRRKVPY